jgi:nitrite reductase/ring-hydroxylating ferredoxin subunit
MSEPAASGPMHRLCAVADIADGKAAEFDLELGGTRRLLFAARRGDDVFVYLNYCPHMGRPLNFAPGRFLINDENEIYCAFHYACFRIEDGFCTDGPCRHFYLGRFDTRVEGGEVFVGETLIWPDPEP